MRSHPSGLTARYLKACLQHFCRHNSTRRPTQEGESTKCFSRHDTIFCEHPDTHFCAHRDTTRASTCTKNVQRSQHNLSIDLHKIVHGSTHNHTDHNMPKSTIFTHIYYVHAQLYSHVFYSYDIYLLFYLSRWIMNEIINNMIVVYHLPF